jgi:hypothetical protein
MLTYAKFICPNCKVEDNQKILFLGSEFSYECIHCGSFHCFQESIYWDFTDNFLYHGPKIKWHLSRYVGTKIPNGNWLSKPEQLHTRTNWDVANIHAARNAFSVLLQELPCFQEKLDIQNIKLSDKEKNGLFYISNAVPNNHFQECLRGVLRIKDHALSPEGQLSYNILIMSEKTNICIEPISKMTGIDEILIVPWNNKATWSYVEKNLRDTNFSLSLSKSVNSYLDNIDGKARAISKRAGPSKYGTSTLKQLLSVEKFDLFNKNGEILKDKYVAILVHYDSKDRAGFDSENQVKEVYDFIKELELKPIVIIAHNKDYRNFEKIDNVLIAKNLKEQICFYENHCLGVIGTNCSGCNIPCLFNLPILSFAKGRSFPDDFYCMGRMLSPYEPSAFFNGNLFKPENVMEVKIDINKPTSIRDHLDLAKQWITLKVKKS